MQLIEKVSTLSEKFYAIDMTHFEEDVEKTLLGLGFERSDFNRPTSEFSGGWRMRIELAKLLLKSPDVLLLDEPTNHLDIESIGWLEDFIINSSKAVVVISHDRKFVDNITTRTIEVTMGRIYDYKASYSHYLELRKERREQQMKQYEEQQKMIAETKDFIERFKGTYSKTFQVQSRVKMLEKLELIEVDEEDTSRLRLKFPPSPRSGAYPVQMSDVAMTFDDKTIFSGVNLTVERGDKIAFVGRNGEGKSTLVKASWDNSRTKDNSTSDITYRLATLLRTRHHCSTVNSPFSRPLMTLQRGRYAIRYATCSEPLCSEAKILRRK